MVKRFTLFAAALVITASARADIATKKFDWAPGAQGGQNLDFQWNNLSVSQIVWNLGDTLKPLRVSTASAEVRVDNNGFIDQVVGVAVAVFDDQGNMVAAGSGGNKLGHLDKGERDHFRVAFPYVYQNLKNGKYFYVTIETRGKETWKGSQPKT